MTAEEVVRVFGKRPVATIQTAAWILCLEILHVLPAQVGSPRRPKSPRRRGHLRRDLSRQGEGRHEKIIFRPEFSLFLYKKQIIRLFSPPHVEDVTKSTRGCRICISPMIAGA
ncbi:hypothetical protein [Xanthobacter sediminis]